MPNVSKKPLAGTPKEDVVSDKNRYIYVEKSVTKNMTDYNSAKVTIGVTLPQGFTDSDLKKAEEAITAAIEIVDRRLTKEVLALFEPGVDDVDTHPLAGTVKQRKR